MDTRLFALHIGLTASLLGFALHLPGPGADGAAIAADAEPHPATFRDCSACPEMVVIPPGSFVMGSPNEEKGRYPSEGPQHPVTIPVAFAVSKYEITVDQFKAFVMATGRDLGSSCWTYVNGDFVEKPGINWKAPGFPQGGAHPVLCINWNDAQAYVAWLAERTGARYRLLTEAEWEYAARAGTTTVYSFGNDARRACRFANVFDGSGRRGLSGTHDWMSSPCNDSYVHTAPVGSFLPNGFGLYDMHGNVSEWVEDCWHDSFQGAPADGSAWTTGTCDERGLRGGSWNAQPRHSRSAMRAGGAADLRSTSIGFHIGKSLP